MWVLETCVCSLVATKTGYVKSSVTSLPINTQLLYPETVVRCYSGAQWQVVMPAIKGRRWHLWGHLVYDPPQEIPIYPPLPLQLSQGGQSLADTDILATHQYVAPLHGKVYNYNFRCWSLLI